MAKKKQLNFDTYKQKYPGIEEVKAFHEEYKSLIHASNILQKAEECANEDGSSSKIEKLNVLITKYLQYVKDQLSIKLEGIEYIRVRIPAIAVHQFR